MSKQKIYNCNTQGHDLVKTSWGSFCNECFKEFGCHIQLKEYGTNEGLPKLKFPPPPPRRITTDKITFESR